MNLYTGYILMNAIRRSNRNDRY
ncbi:protein of unknown function [Methanoculleus bourgensis]|uniref:Uncharacterized protein n=1 Tax=Methanoculleus bourgensis TaxID=83986 RepID=A0A0X3BN26_9EURY|nr:protein of unknown function [Methanoculleus bourgensis]